MIQMVKKKFKVPKTIKLENDSGKIQNVFFISSHFNLKIMENLVNRFFTT